MNRRTFIKMLAAAGIAPVIPEITSLSAMYKSANAAKINYESLTVSAPAVMPQVINLFLYGGPSELAGNLSNIVDIEENSQNKYEDFFPGLTAKQGANVPDNGSRTPRDFWGSNVDGAGIDMGMGAGGDDMEFLVENNYMSVYRTMMKRKNTSQSHRESIFASQKGSLDTDFSAGMANKLASIISTHKVAYQTTTKLADNTDITDVETLVMPFVSISDGATRVFDKGDSDPLPLLFNGISVKNDLSNPFSRDVSLLNPGDTDILDALVDKAMAESTKDYKEIENAFDLREQLETDMEDFAAFNLDILPNLLDQDDIDANGGSAAIVYPTTTFGQSIRAAVTLAIENPGSMFITLGGALGGWDDHNNGVDEYPERMRTVFESLRIAMMHIKYSDFSKNGGNSTLIKGLDRRTDNIIINVYGDFGRRVNLNGSLGWNHGNNQNFFTLGGDMPGLRSAAGGADVLGNMVGTTKRVGDKNADAQFTQPDDANAYEFEPIAIAASLFKYFGVVYPATVDATTPDPLTMYVDPENNDLVIDPGEMPIEESKAVNGGVDTAV